MNFLVPYAPVRKRARNEVPRQRKTIQYLIRKTNGELITVCAKTFESVTTISRGSPCTMDTMYHGYFCSSAFFVQNKYTALSTTTKEPIFTRVRKYVVLVLSLVISHKRTWRGKLKYLEKYDVIWKHEWNKIYRAWNFLQDEPIFYPKFEFFLNHSLFCTN